MVKTIRKLLLLIVFLIIGNNNNYAHKMPEFQKSRDISFFRITGYFNNFSLKINDDFCYKERKQAKGHDAMGYLITKYKTTSNTLHIYLKINNRDTAFNYILSNYDSLMLGAGKGHFFCWTKKDYIWAND